jgi:hypothetical protein
MGRKKVAFMKDYVNSNWTAASNQAAKHYGGLSLLPRPIRPEGTRRIFEAKSGGQLQSEYAKNLLAINNYIVSLASMNIPPMNPSPDHYGDYMKLFANVKASAVTWNNEINVQLLSAPKVTIRSLTTFQLLLDEIIDTAKKLQANPGSAYLNDTITSDIAYAKTGIAPIIKRIEDLEKSMDSFHNDMPEQVKQLKKIAELMLSDKGTDEAQVKKIQADIDDLNSQISSLTAAIVGLGIADAAAISIGAFALFAGAGPIGIAISVFAGIAVAVATTYIALDGIEIKNCKKKIEQDMKDLTQWDAVIIVLQEQSDLFTKLAEEMTALQDNLKLMIQCWKEIENGLNEAEKEILAGGQDYDKKDWESVEKDFQSAKEKTAEIIENVKSYAITNLEGTTAKLTVGMSADEVKAAIDAAETMPITDYIRQLA